MAPSTKQENAEYSSPIPCLRDVVKMGQMPYVSKLTPYPHQSEALKRMRGRRAFALLMSMRTGKSKVICDEFASVVMDNAGRADLLLIAPAGVYKTWVDEFKKQWSDNLLNASMIGVWESGASRQKLAVLEHIVLSSQDFPGPRILIVNIEALSSVQRARELCAAFVTQRKCTLVIDESTTIKTPSAARTKFVVQKLGPLAAYRRILSGLPTPRSPLDIFSQMEFLDWKILGFRSFYAFRARYAVMVRKNFGGRSVPVVVGYRHEEELRAAIAPHSYRVTLDDVRDAAPPVYAIREVDLTDEQKHIYKEVLAKATAMLSSGDHVTATSVITQVLRLHQILCGHVRDENDVLHHVPEKRTQALLDILGEYDGKAIIWTNYDYCVKSITNALRKDFGENSVARFWGGNLDTREDEEARFKNDAQCRFMVATQAAGGRGRTWSVADLHVFYSNSYDLEHRDQAEQRAEGVQKGVQASRIDLVARGTVDEKILKALRDKIDLASAITGDAWREWVV
jgi:SNF2 family DNA or RNA helicase